MTTTKRYFPELTGVRAVMMYCVFNCHFNLVGREAYGEPLYRFSPVLHDWLLRFTHELAVGVPVFYVLSGFLIYYRYGEALVSFQPRWLLQYVQNRAARIYPVYFLVLLFTYYCWSMLPEVFADRVFPDVRTLLVTFTLTQSFFPDLVQSGIAQSWTLTIEETFYFSAPLLFLAARRGNLLWACVAVFLLGVLLVNVPIIGPYYQNPSHVFGRTICGPIGCFGFGAFLAQIVIRYGNKLPSGRRPVWTYLGLTASTLVVLAVSRIGTWLPERGYLHRGVDHGLGAALIFTIFPAFVALTFWGLITEESRLKRLLGSRLMVLLGGASYCFYLIHVGAVQQLIFTFVSTNYIVLFFIINALAIALFLLVEKPANAYLKHLGHVPQVDLLRGFPRPVRAHARRWGQAIVVGAVVVAFAVPALLRAAGNVAAHNELLREDGLYETLQAGLCAAAAAALGLAWIGSLWQPDPALPTGRTGVRRFWRSAILLALALMMLLMTGEEISWGQRIFGFETPEWIKRQNFQGELTFHNWAVFQPQQSGNRLQNAWLVGVAVYLGALPWLASLWPRLGRRLRRLGIPLASRLVASLTLASLAWYAITAPWSEVLELVFDWLLLVFALEVAMARRPFAADDPQPHAEQPRRAAQPAARAMPSPQPAKAPHFGKLPEHSGTLATRSDNPSAAMGAAPIAQWVPLGVAAAVAPLMLLLLFQGGEHLLPSVRSLRLSDEGNRFFQRGDVALAVERWKKALDTWPRNTAATWALGQWALRQGRLDEAEAYLRQTRQLEPDHAPAAAEWARLAAARGQTDQAVARWREAVRLDPNNAEYHVQLAEALFRADQPEEALRIYRRVVRQFPENAVAANNLAWYLATLPDPRLRDGREAVRLARRACEQTGHRQPSLLSTLAAAYAEAGQFDQAVQTTRRVIALAEANGQDDLAAKSYQRLARYQAGRPLRQKPAG